MNALTSLRAVRSFDAHMALVIVDGDAYRPRVATDFAVLNEAAANVWLDEEFYALPAVRTGDRKRIVHGRILRVAEIRSDSGGRVGGAERSRSGRSLDR